MVEPHGPFGKYCSDHCKQAGQKTELRCDCQHPPCRWCRRVRFAVSRNVGTVTHRAGRDRRQCACCTP